MCQLKRSRGVDFLRFFRAREHNHSESGRLRIDLTAAEGSFEVRSDKRTRRNLESSVILERLFDILTLLIVNRDENAALQFRAEFFKLMTRWAASAKSTAGSVNAAWAVLSRSEAFIV